MQCPAYDISIGNYFEKRPCQLYSTHDFHTYALVLLPDQSCGLWFGNETMCVHAYNDATYSNQAELRTVLLTRMNSQL